MKTQSKDHVTSLITGASSGIGWELAELCARSGHDVVLVARREQKLAQRAEELAGRYSTRAQFVALDLAQCGAARALVSELKLRGLRVDILINSAGVALYGPFAESNIEQQSRLLRLNIENLTELTHLLLAQMVNRGHGRILNVASLGSYIPGPLLATYFASKAYLLSLSQALAEELRDSGVTVTALVAGPTNSGFAATTGICETRAFSAGVMDARDVAEVGYRAMMRGQRIVVAGWRNRLRLLPVRFTPTRVLTYFARRYHELPLRKTYPVRS